MFRFRADGTNERGLAVLRVTPGRPGRQPGAEGVQRLGDLSDARLLVPRRMMRPGYAREVPRERGDGAPSGAASSSCHAPVAGRVAPLGAPQVAFSLRRRAALSRTVPSAPRPSAPVRLIGLSRLRPSRSKTCRPRQPAPGRGPLYPRAEPRRRPGVDLETPTQAPRRPSSGVSPDAGHRTQRQISGASSGSSRLMRRLCASAALGETRYGI